MTVVSAATSFKTTLPATHMLLGPIETPGATKTRAAIQEPLRTVIGRVIRSNLGDENRCEPVHKNAPCEMQQSDSMTISSRFSMNAFSPIQTWSPIVRRQGKVIDTSLRMTTPTPIRAPKQRSTKHRTRDGNGYGIEKKKNLATIQATSVRRLAPRSKQLR